MGNAKLMLLFQNDLNQGGAEFVPNEAGPSGCAGAEPALTAQGGLMASGRACRACRPQPGCPPGPFQAVFVCSPQRAALGSHQLAGQLGEEVRALLFFSRKIQHSSLVKY